MSEYGGHFAAKMKQALATHWSGSIAELARQAQVSAPYIFHILAGRVQDPSFRRLSRLSQTLGVPLEYWNGSIVHTPACPPPVPAEQQLLPGGG